MEKKVLYAAEECGDVSIIAVVSENSFGTKKLNKKLTDILYDFLNVGELDKDEPFEKELIDDFKPLVEEVSNGKNYEWESYYFQYEEVPYL